YVGIVGFTILVWDHLVTSGDEIEFIWKGRKGILVYLFLLNRYLTPLGFLINLVGEYITSCSQFHFCQHFVRFEGAMTAIGIEIVGLMMLIRVIAMYRHQRPAIVLAVLLLLAWIAVTAWLLSNGEHVNSEILSSGSVASASAWLPLLYDTYVFGLTLHRTFPSIRNKEAGHVIRTLLADGLLYYSVICTVNLVLTIMIIRASEGLKNIAAQYAHLRVTMMSRITLNLKKEAYYGPSRLHLQAESIIMSTCNRIISTPSGEVIALSRLRSRSVPSGARVWLSSRARSGSTSSLAPPVRTITFAENPTIYDTKILDVESPMGGSPVIEHADWPSASNSNKWNTADIV
ncbi:hypothetical protein F4604DRAFT_1578947, partial [Suillus subluteus]